MTSEQPSPVDPQDPASSTERVVVRRAPKVWGFLAAGALVGVVATLVLTFAFRPGDGSPTVTEDGTEFGLTQVFGFLLVCLIPLGAALGALVAIVLDRILARGAVEVDVERTDVEGSVVEGGIAEGGASQRGAADRSDVAVDRGAAENPSDASPTTPNEDPATT